MWSLYKGESYIAEKMNILDLNEVDFSLMNNYLDLKTIADYARPSVV